MSIQFTIYLCLAVSPFLFFLFIFQGNIAVGATTIPRQNVRICVLQTPDTHHRVTQSQQMQEYVLFLSSSLPWPCLFPSLIPFFPIGVYALPGDISGRDDEPDRLTRVLFDYYFGTYRALVISLCGHMVVQG